MEPIIKIKQMTNHQLRKNGKEITTEGEVLKFFGIIILFIKNNEDKRASLWITTATFKYIPAGNFCRIGTKRNKFDDL